MPDPSTDDSITKSEAAAIYRRSERSLSRDITNAVKLQDATVLDNVALRLEDGTRRPGRELTIKEIVELRDRGLNPTWLLQRAWLQSTYGLRNESVTERRAAGSVEEVENDSPSVQGVTSTPLPEILPERVAVLAAQNDSLERMNADLRNQTLRLEKELDRRAEERREENELQKQNNVLMQQVYDLLSKMQQSPGQINILNQGREVSPAIAEAAISQERPTVVVAAPMPGKQKGTGPKSDLSKSTKRAVAPRKQSPAKRPTTRREPPKKPRGRRPRTGTAVGRYLPTFDKAVRSFFRK